MASNKEWVNLSMDKMIRAADDSELLKRLPDRVRRILFTTATAAWTYFQSSKSCEGATIIMLHLQWLADQELKDHGVVTRDDMTTYYHAVDDIVTRFTEAELKARKIEVPAAPPANFDMSKES